MRPLPDWKDGLMVSKETARTQIAAKAKAFGPGRRTIKARDLKDLDLRETPEVIVIGAEEDGTPITVEVDDELP